MADPSSDLLAAESLLKQLSSPKDIASLPSGFGRIGPSSRPFVITPISDDIQSKRHLLLSIKQLGQSPLEVTINCLDPIHTLKRQIQESTRVPVVSQRLLFKGKGLSDWKCLMDYGIESGSTINLMVKSGVVVDKEIPMTGSLETPLVKPVETVAASQETLQDILKNLARNTQFWTELEKVVSDHYTPDQSGQVCRAFL